MNETKIKSEIRLTRKTLKAICWLNGYSVVGLARALDRNPTLLYLTCDDPTRYPAVWEEMNKALPIREVRR